VNFCSCQRGNTVLNDLVGDNQFVATNVCSSAAASTSAHTRTDAATIPSANVLCIDAGTTASATDIQV
jgi:hypothetical protein